jgi:hypothetical protein
MPAAPEQLNHLCAPVTSALSTAQPLSLPSALGSVVPSAAGSTSSKPAGKAPPQGASKLPQNVIMTVKTPGNQRFGVKLKIACKQLRIGSRYCDAESASRVARAFRKVATVIKGKKDFEVNPAALAACAQRNEMAWVYAKWKRSKEQIPVHQLLTQWLTKYFSQPRKGRQAPLLSGRGAPHMLHRGGYGAYAAPAHGGPAGPSGWGQRPAAPQGWQQHPGSVPSWQPQGRPPWAAAGGHGDGGWGGGRDGGGGAGGHGDPGWGGRRGGGGGMPWDAPVPGGGGGAYGSPTSWGGPGLYDGRAPGRAGTRPDRAGGDRAGPGRAGAPPGHAQTLRAAQTRGGPRRHEYPPAGAASRDPSLRGRADDGSGLGARDTGDELAAALNALPGLGRGSGLEPARRDPGWSAGRAAGDGGGAEDGGSLSLLEKQERRIRQLESMYLKMADSNRRLQQQQVSHVKRLSTHFQPASAADADSVDALLSAAGGFEEVDSTVARGVSNPRGVAPTHDEARGRIDGANGSVGVNGSVGAASRAEAPGSPRGGGARTPTHGVAPSSQDGPDGDSPDGDSPGANGAARGAARRRVDGAGADASDPPIDLSQLDPSLPGISDNPHLYMQKVIAQLVSNGSNDGAVDELGGGQNHGDGRHGEDDAAGRRPAKVLAPEVLAAIVERLEREEGEGGIILLESGTKGVGPSRIIFENERSRVILGGSLRENLIKGKHAIPLNLLPLQIFSLTKLALGIERRVVHENFKLVRFDTNTDVKVKAVQRRIEIPDVLDGPDPRGEEDGMDAKDDVYVYWFSPLEDQTQEAADEAPDAVPLKREGRRKRVASPAP